VDILSMEADSDNLHFGDVTLLKHWSQETGGNISHELSIILQQVFEDNTLLSRLYPNKSMSSASWVIARWLEILPVNVAVKSTFIDEHDLEETKAFIQSIVLKEY
jgi:hypothetical protein